MTLYVCQAEDADKISNIVYAIEDADVEHLFEIDSSSGEITVVNETGVWRVNNSDTVTFTISVSFFIQPNHTYEAVINELRFVRAG